MRLHHIRDVAVRNISSVTRARHTTSGSSILVMQPDHLGDILLSQPAVRAIRHRFPDHTLIGVVGPWSEHVARAAWDVNIVVPVTVPAFDRAARRRNPLSPYSSLVEASNALKATEPAGAFVLRPDDWWSAWLASTVTTGPVVTAQDPRMDPFATVQVDVTRAPHAAQKAFAIASERLEVINAGDQELTFPVNDLAAHQARELLRRMGVGERYVVIHPGTGADVKTWPAHRWRFLANELASSGEQVVITGSSGEAGLADFIAADIESVTSIAGNTDLDELAETLRGADLVVGPDSGPLHLAVACQAPTVHLFGPSDPARYGPWGCAERHQIVSEGWSCARCGDLSPARSSGCGCMLAITTGTVMNAVRATLKASHAAR